MKLRFFFSAAVAAVFAAAGFSLLLAAQSRPAPIEETASAFAPAHEPERAGLPHFWDDEPHEALAEKIAAAMTDEELLAQIFMFGWAGDEPSNELIAWVEERSLGNVKIFGWDTRDAEKVALAVNLLQEKALGAGRFGIPLFVATDQEGGLIRHIKGITSETPGNMAIGASALPSDAYYSGYYIAAELAALGVNMNFAPTVDLYTNRDSTVIGTRSFGEAPQAAGVLGAAFAAGTRDAGVLPTAKHFPGHGDTELDSHGILPAINADREMLESRELVPFKALIDSGIPAVMTAHVSFPQVTGTNEPASLSRYFLQDILREEMGHEGLIITDDIVMNGAAQYAGSVSRAAEIAILAGNDIIVSSTVPAFDDAFWTRNIENMKHDGFRAAVEKAACRVIKAKLEYFKGGNSVPIYSDIAKIPERIPAPGSAEFFLSQAARSITLLYGEELLPITEERGGKILIAAAFQDFRDAGMERFPKADTALMNRGIFNLNLEEYDTIIFGISSETNLGILNSLSDFIRGNATIVAVSIQEPALITRTEVPDAALAIYSYSPYSFRAAFAAIAGDFVPEGSPPFAVAVFNGGAR